jgi:hypothetical protein
VWGHVIEPTRWSFTYSHEVGSAPQLRGGLLVAGQHTLPLRQRMWCVLEEKKAQGNAGGDGEFERARRASAG